MVTYFHPYVGPKRGKIYRSFLERWKSKEGVIWENESLHLLTITDRPENIELLKQLLHIIDRPEPQVMIEVKVVEVTHDSELDYGTSLGWDGTLSVFHSDDLDSYLDDSSSVFDPDSYLKAVSSSTTFQGFTQTGALKLSRDNQSGILTHTLRTLLLRGQAEVLSAPRILVMNGKSAKILTGEKVPIQTVQIKNNVQTITTRYDEVGVKLEVTPHIVSESSVELEVIPEVSSVTSYTDPTNVGVANPIISTRNAHTHVYVRDRETLIIGGLLTNQSVITQRGIPFLMDIPLLGYLFKSYRRVSKKTELIFFITPHIRRHPLITLPPRERNR